MSHSTNGVERVNLFALVVYIQDPLARFLDDLRKELVPVCLPHAHVTLLPPRPLTADLDQAIDRARAVLSEFPSFDIVAGEVEIFPITDVIYIGIRKGERELRDVHRALNTGPLAFNEPYPYHPHITLAQGLAPGQAKPLYELARKRWSEFQGSKLIRAERACFVQATACSTWVDLAEFRLAAVQVG